MQTECLVRPASDVAELAVNVRFLHPTWREVGTISRRTSLSEPMSEADFKVVPELSVDGVVLQTWQEAVEREIESSSMRLRETPHWSVTIPFSFPASSILEPLFDSGENIAGAIRRRQKRLEGAVEMSCCPIDASVSKISVRIRNETPVFSRDLDSPDEVLMRTLASTHTLLRVQGGEFLSAMDPPGSYRQASSECNNIGAWPVLVGDEEKQERDALLSSPIIMYDYPKIAPESAGNLFDGTEIDEILSLRIKTLTNQEKNEMRNADQYARRLLDRTEALSDDQFLALHGRMKQTSSPQRFADRDLTEPPFQPGSFDDQIFGSSVRLEGVAKGNRYLRVGDRVRIRPKTRGDVIDLAIAGKEAFIEAVEQDAEGRIHLGLVLEEDPGRDLGFLRQPGHRFFYGLEEVEPLCD